MIRKLVILLLLGCVSAAAGSLVFRRSAASPNPSRYSTSGNTRGVPAALRRAGTALLDPSDLTQSVEGQLKMNMALSVDRGVFGGGGAFVHLLTAPTTDGQSCLLSDTSHGPATSCLAGDLFSQHEVVYLVQSDGGPSPSALNYWRVVGVAAPEIDGLEIVSKSGLKSAVPLNAQNAFDFEASVASMQSGDLPVSLIALRHGAEVATFPVTQ